MRRPDRQVMDPEVVASLEAIDATLAGEPVDPGRTELAELAVLLRDERPQVPVELSARLDERVARGFARPRSSGSRRRRRAWLGAPAPGLAAGVIAAVGGVAGGLPPARPAVPRPPPPRTAPRRPPGPP